MKFDDTQQAQEVDTAKLPVHVPLITDQEEVQTISKVFGLLKEKTSGSVVSIGKIRQAIAIGWAGDKQ